ncbi:MAG: hypothetical protein LBR23_03360 [Spirochaetaceae bacterium]|jgi:outer membrane protein OmpA-like peptidoglycan-associated protein|nr:hypothetical protein [Spirochaetaceae bacterium]
MFVRLKKTCRGRVLAALFTLAALCAGAGGGAFAQTVHIEAGVVYPLIYLVDKKSFSGTSLPGIEAAGRVYFNDFIGAGVNGMVSFLTTEDLGFGTQIQFLAGPTFLSRMEKLAFTTTTGFYGYLLFTGRGNAMEFGMGVSWGAEFHFNNRLYAYGRALGAASFSGHLSVIPCLGVGFKINDRPRNAAQGQSQVQAVPPPPQPAALEEPQEIKLVMGPLVFWGDDDFWGNEPEGENIRNSVALEQIAILFNSAFKDYDIMIVGYANPAEGKSDSDLRSLSGARAKYIMDILHDLYEVDSDRMTAVGAGGQPTVVDPGDPNNGWTNGRVEFTVKKKMP